MGFLFLSIVRVSNPKDTVKMWQGITLAPYVEEPFRFFASLRFEDLRYFPG
jgi:hypothetical protein